MLRCDVWSLVIQAQAKLIHNCRAQLMQRRRLEWMDGHNYVAIWIVALEGIDIGTKLILGTKFGVTG